MNTATTYAIDPADSKSGPLAYVSAISSSFCVASRPSIGKELA